MHLAPAHFIKTDRNNLRRLYQFHELQPKGERACLCHFYDNDEALNLQLPELFNEYASLSVSQAKYS